MTYNLLDERWIPVLWTDGRFSREGIMVALTQAGRIRGIYSSSPLDTFSIHRFLLTLLYWKADLGGGIGPVRASLLTGELPSSVLTAIKEEADCFDLFSKEAPFLQDRSLATVKEGKSPAELFAELAKATNIAHFNHADDGNMRLCLPCVTLGLLRVVPWTQSGGAGLTPSVHNAPPIMAMAIGDNLAITLGLNLIPLDGAAGRPQWSGHFKPTAPLRPVSYLEALTWNPRRILLSSPVADTCWYCGKKSEATIGKIVYLKNDYTKKRADKRLFAWQDPAAYYAVYDSGKKYDASKNAPFKTIKSHDEGRAVYDGDLPDAAEVGRPAVFVQNRTHKRWLLVVPTTNPKNNKTFDQRQVVVADVSQMTPGRRPPLLHQEIDGWTEPEESGRKDSERFLRTAVTSLTREDWAALANAAYCHMHQSPAAFDVLSGLYWGLLNRKNAGLPARNVAWLMLKLMATVPPGARPLQAGATFRPHLLLPKRQLNERDRASPHPVRFPRGRRLEAALREVLVNHLRGRNPEPIDWVSLCVALDQLAN